MKIVRLNPTDARVWRENRTVLLDAQGSFVRYLGMNESQALTDIEKKARHLRQPVRAEVKEGTRVSILTATPTPISRETIVIKSTVDGLDVLDGRSYFMRQVLDQHGECQIRSHTGQFMRSVRDPSVLRPTVKDASRNAPKPQHCPCASWGMEHPGRHHPICEWNAKAPPDERARAEDSLQAPANMPLPPALVRAEKPSILSSKVTALGSPTAAPSPVTMTGAGLPAPLGSPTMTVPGAASVKVTVAAPKPLAPGECFCKEWAKTPASEDGKHHPICQWKEPWEASVRNEPVMVLVNLQTGEVSRAATADEIATARSEKGFVLIGEDQYGVMPESEAKRLEGAA